MVATFSEVKVAVYLQHFLNKTTKSKLIKLVVLSVFLHPNIQYFKLKVNNSFRNRLIRFRQIFVCTSQSLKCFFLFCSVKCKWQLSLRCLQQKNICAKQPKTHWFLLHSGALSKTYHHHHTYDHLHLAPSSQNIFQYIEVIEKKLNYMYSVLLQVKTG